MAYRLGLDLGSNSIGWCAVELDESHSPCGILDAGVRILSPNEEAGRDPQSKSSLAATRRLARSMRRNRDRFVRRQTRLMEILVDVGLMPTDHAERKKLEVLDPYWLRRAALNQHLPPHEVGRALFHIGQRRGFLSNRIADAGNDDSSAMKAGVRALEALCKNEGARTLGELLANWHQRDRKGKRQSSSPRSVRFRPTPVKSKNLYDYYPTRAMVEAELDEIWKKQKKYHRKKQGKEHKRLPPASIFNNQTLKRIKQVVIKQRPLKRPIVGRCTLMPDEIVKEPYGFPIDSGERTPKAHPLFQRFRILQDLCQLRVTDSNQAERYLTVDERDLLADLLLHRSAKIIHFEQFKRALNLPDDATFNYEYFGKKGFQTDQAARLLSSKKAFGAMWHHLTKERQIEVIERLLAVQVEDDLINWLQKQFDLDKQAIRYIVGLRLPAGHAKFGRRALKDLVETMSTETCEAINLQTGELYQRPLKFDEAVAHIGLHHSDMRPKEQYKHLPYYGKILTRHVTANTDASEGSQEHIGRVTNPTVHICLNQVREVVNTLINTYGHPTGIVVELARDLKLNKKRKDELSQRNRKNEKENDQIREQLSELKLADTHDNRLRLRLFRELPADERVCIYSGTPICMQMLFDGRVEIDHILPYSRTLDDSFANKVLCLRHANRHKRNRAPAEVWSDSDLHEIYERAKRLFKNKAWCFQSNAMQRFDDQGGFLARQLKDTEYMSRLARMYLEHICPNNVLASRGRLTGMLRANWGLNSVLWNYKRIDSDPPSEDGTVLGATVVSRRSNRIYEWKIANDEKSPKWHYIRNASKNRNDHRHHAIDAFVLACTDTVLLHRISAEAAHASELDLDRLFAKNSFPKPFDDYRDNLARILDKITISHRPDHGIDSRERSSSQRTSGKLFEDTAYGSVSEEIEGTRYNLVYRKPIDSLKQTEIKKVRDGNLRAALSKVVRGIPDNELSKISPHMASNKNLLFVTYVY